MLAGALLLGAGLAGHLRQPIGISDAACALALLGVSLRVDRTPGLRWVLFSLGVWLMLSPFVATGAGPISYLIEVLVGKVVLLTAPASAELFT